MHILFRCNECGIVTDHLPAMKHCLSYLDNWYKSCDPVTSMLTTGNNIVLYLMDRNCNNEDMCATYKIVVMVIPTGSIVMCV